jgi:hypothetical protein
MTAAALSTDGAMIFSPFACFPQVPSVAAVRIALYKRTRERSFVSSWPHCWIRVASRDWNIYSFCEANAETFVVNARRCADIHLSAQKILGHPLSVTLDSRGQMMLDRLITGHLAWMCLSAAPENSRQSLLQLWEEALDGIPWDPSKATDLLAAAL